MALGDVGLFNPAESTYTTPGAYGETLKATALQNAQYLSMMDQFYEQLEETTRQFNETLGFKESELAQSKWIAEQDIGLKGRQLDITEKLGTADLALRSRIATEEAEYKQESLDVQRMAISAQYGASGMPLSSYQKMDLLTGAQKLKADELALTREYLLGQGTAGPKSSVVNIAGTSVQSGTPTQSAWDTYQFPADYIFGTKALGASGFKAENKSVTDLDYLW